MRRRSSYENHIYKILKKEKINFIEEYMPKNRKVGKRGSYRYDFAIFEEDNLLFLCEINGEQHYTRNKFFYKTEKDFKASKERDRRKISLALANSIPLYIVPFFEVAGIKSIKDIQQTKFLATNKWHNDNLQIP